MRTFTAVAALSAVLLLPHAARTQPLDPKQVQAQIDAIKALFAPVSVDRATTAGFFAHFQGRRMIGDDFVEQATMDANGKSNQLVLALESRLQPSTGELAEANLVNIKDVWAMSLDCVNASAGRATCVQWDFRITPQSEIVEVRVHKKTKADWTAPEITVTRRLFPKDAEALAKWKELEPRFVAIMPSKAA